MESGAITGYIDVAQLVLYAFWIFFAGLIYYLRREDKREGYPLETTDRRSGRVRVQGFPPIPVPKTFALPHGGSVSAPSGQADTREIKATPVGAWPGAPLQPTGDPMLDAVGPASYAMRADTPDLTLDGRPKIVPVRTDPGCVLDVRDPDPRGMAVVAADGKVAGKVVDAWVDRSETILRYLEIEVAAAGGSRRVLLPINFSRIGGRDRKVRVASITAAQFANVPGLRNPEQVTLREEDRIAAYYASGHLYATPLRLGPWL
jgi:photosynthetic reaction center H subunit